LGFSSITSITLSRDFSGITPIIPSRDFSIEMLTEVTPPWKIEYPDGCITAVRYVVRKMATMEDGLV